MICHKPQVAHLEPGPQRMCTQELKLQDVATWLKSLQSNHSSGSNYPINTVVSEVRNGTDRPQDVWQYMGVQPPTFGSVPSTLTYIAVWNFPLSRWQSTLCFDMFLLLHHPSS